MNIVLNKSISWLLPFLEKSSYIHNIDKLKRITAMKPRPYVEQHVDARLRQIGNEFRITLFTHYWNHKIRKKKIIKITLKPCSRIDILTDLAHELSHLDLTKYPRGDWALHTPERWIIEAEICQIYALKLIEDGYVSEEKELKALRKSG